MAPSEYVLSGMDKNIEALYNHPFPSTRTGALFNAFSYPTKISPEAVALFIACHTSIGESVLDPFGGSCTTAIAAKLADAPTPFMIKTASSMGLSPKWGPRRAVVYEISTIGALLGDVICNTPVALFNSAVASLLEKADKELSYIYSIVDNSGQPSSIRHIIWSDVLICPFCHSEIPYHILGVKENPISFCDKGSCPHCGQLFNLSNAERATVSVHDPLLNEVITQRKRIPFKIYGNTDGSKWSRFATPKDISNTDESFSLISLEEFPLYKIKWGKLFRHGYHTGITHLHHFYTRRNAYVYARLFKLVETFPAEIRNALRVFLLSYNSTHSTLMTRVVAKHGNNDFVLTGAQPGVLYISSLPVEKNILIGLRRKFKTFSEALSIIASSRSSVEIRNSSSLHMEKDYGSIDYVFTDPPFGDYIPYSEINQINEAWLGSMTDISEEVVINETQGKYLAEYSQLISAVFKEIECCTKPQAMLTIAFHSAKAEIWRTIITAYKNNGFFTKKASILDKVQNSFKQTNSNINVKGDPLILLSKTTKDSPNSFSSEDEVLSYLNFFINETLPTPKPSEIHSCYLMLCIENDIKVTKDAIFFYENYGA